MAQAIIRKVDIAAPKLSHPSKEAWVGHPGPQDRGFALHVLV